MATTYIKLGPIGDIFTSDILGIYLTPDTSAEIDEQLIDTRLKSFIATGFLVIISKVEHDNLRLKSSNARNIPLTIIPIDGTHSIEPVNSVTRIPPATLFKGNRFLVWKNPEGAWAGKEDYIAEYTGSGWQFTKPYNGLSIPVYEWGISVKYSGTYPSGFWSYDEETIAQLDLTLVENLRDEAYALELFTQEAEARAEADADLRELITNFINNYTVNVKASGVLLDDVDNYYGPSHVEGALIEIARDLRDHDEDIQTLFDKLNQTVQQSQGILKPVYGSAITIDYSIAGEVQIGLDFSLLSDTLLPVRLAPATKTKITYNDRGLVVSGEDAVPSDLVNFINPSTGKINDTWLPKLAITNTFVRNSQAAMLSVDAQEGDMVIRTDINKSFILAASDPTILSSWQELLSPTDGVQSVTLAMPAEFGITNATITNTGTISVAWANQTQAKVFAAPALSTGVPTFRALVATDIPAHSHVWTDISDRPTSLSQFTNNLGNYGNWITKAQADTYYPGIGLLGNSNGIATLDATGKIPSSQLPSGAQVYKGTWDASTNTPTLVDGTGTAGWTYRVSVGGTRNLGSGNITFVAGDDIIYSGTTWQRNPSSSTVVSVNGLQGAVVLTTTNISEGSKLYYLDSRVKTYGDTQWSLLSHTHAYSAITGKPTNLSQFTNDLGNYGGYLLADGATYAGFAGDNINQPYMRHTTSNTVVGIARIDGINAGGTWPINVTGSAYSWNGTQNNFLIGVQSAGMAASVGTDSGGTAYRFDQGATRAFLGLTSMAYKNENEIHRFGNFGVDANTVAEHTSNFTYAVNAPYTGPLVYFGTNNYGMQLNANYTSTVGLSYRTRNGDNQTWNPWRDIWHSGNLTPAISATGYSVVQRDANGYIMNTYINTTDDVNFGGLNYLVGKISNDNYHRSFTVGAVRSWLGLSDFAYASFGTTTLQMVTNQGNSTSNKMSIAYDGVGDDPYGVMSVSRSPAAQNYSYYGMTRSGLIGWGIGIDSSNRIIFGTGSNGGTNYTIGNVVHSFDANGSAIHNGNLTVGGNTILQGNTTINNASALALGSDSSIGYYFATINMRGNILHKYVSRNSDNVAVAWKENWWNGNTYFEWSTDSKGFYGNAKLTLNSGEDGSVTYQGGLEVRGTNAGITFHYPGSWASPLWVNSAGTLHWGASLNIGSNITAGNDVIAPQVYGNNAVIGGRVFAGYDSGIAGSVSATNWFRSNGSSGWVNDSFGGGIYMQDYVWVRVHGGKSLHVSNDIYSTTQIRSEAGFKSNTFRGMIGDYDQNGSTDKIIWTIGDGWNQLAQHYGLGYSYVNPLVSSQHQIVGRNNGATTFTLSLTTGGAVFTGYVTAQGGGGVSDIRHKKLIKDDGLDLSFLDNLKMISYTWKDASIDGRDKIHFGYSAQEIDKWCPDLVFKDNPNKFSLNITELQNLEIKRLKERLTLLENELGRKS